MKAQVVVQEFAFCFGKESVFHKIDPRVIVKIVKNTLSRVTIVRILNVGSGSKFPLFEVVLGLKPEFGFLFVGIVLEQHP